MPKHVLKLLFFALLVRPLVLVVIGLNARHRERLPRQGPAIIAANHNSHLDTLVLMSLLPLSLLARVRPVAAADYFLSSRLWSFIALDLIDVLPLERAVTREGATGTDAFFREPIAALERGDILIVFPEGTRGTPEELRSFKSGIARLAEKVPQAPVVPVFLHGLGKALPKGSCVPVPFFCDVFVGAPIGWPGSRIELMARLKASIEALAAEGTFPAWE